MSTPAQSVQELRVSEGTVARRVTVTAEDVERTGRTTTVAQWGVAAVVMVGSAASAGVGFAQLQEHWAIGVITGLGVDLALASGLVIGRRLRAVGVTTYWGTVLLWLTGVMTLCLNSGAAALTGHWVLAVAHAFLPVLLVVLTEAGSEAQLKLHHLTRETLAAEHAERDARLAAERMEREAQQREARRARECEDARRERELAERRQVRDHEARQAVASLAGVLALGATWRRRPATRPRGSGPGTSGVLAARTSPVSLRTTPVSLTQELLDRARTLRERYRAEGKSAGRAVVQRELGVSERTARELVRRLDEQQPQPLRVLSGGEH